MNIFNFIQQFPDENACRLRFKELRDNIGIICDKCNCTEHYWHENKLCYECKHCHLVMNANTVIIVNHYVQGL